MQGGVERRGERKEKGGHTTQKFGEQKQTSTLLALPHSLALPLSLLTSHFSLSLSLHSLVTI
jgi:hypothetical protein